MRKLLLLSFNIVVLLSQSLVIYPARAEGVIDYNAKSLIARAQIFPLPKSATFLEGSTFDVPIFINTLGHSVNTIDLRVSFDQSKLTIVRPSGDKSIIAVWLEPPAYDNTKGTAKLVGIIPNGIITDSGLIATMTFKAIATGEAKVVISQTTRVLLNDGRGTEASTEFGRGSYTILPKPPEGVRVFSDTHPFEDHWYNNRNPVLGWEKDPGVTDFSYILDNKPFTVPDNNPIAKETVKAYENLDDGLWYFHIKALKQGVWGNVTHFLVRIDTTPPAVFTPTVDYLTATIVNRVLVSFFTTDNLSGINHYEVGIIEKSKSPTESPVFIQTESPYQLPLNISGEERVIVRAFDKAGNARDASVDVKIPWAFYKLIQDNFVLILLITLGLILLLLIIHYLFGHHIIAHLRKAVRLIKQEEKVEEAKKIENLSEPIKQQVSAEAAPKTEGVNKPPAQSTDTPENPPRVL